MTNDTDTTDDGTERSTTWTMRDVDHTHPDTDEPFGVTGAYRRGRGRGVRTDAGDDHHDHHDHHDQLVRGDGDVGEGV